MLAAYVSFAPAGSWKLIVIRLCAPQLAALPATTESIVGATLLGEP